MTRVRVHVAIAVIAAAGIACLVQAPDPQWLAGDSHVHSHWSPGYDRTKSPPEPIKGSDAAYAIPTNARMAEQFGLSWMVTTDHGGPNHAKLNLTNAHAELKQSRALVPVVLQFYGLELNMPAMDHHTVIVPHAEDEWSTLFEIESRFDANEVWPSDPARGTETAALAALAYMKALPTLPIVFANHPSRSARRLGVYGRDEPHEFRNNHDLAPEVYRGMEGAPGHQAGALHTDGRVRLDESGVPTGSRGGYGNREAPTLGGFDQMTAIVGGLWDSLLGEGRRFWIVATSDSHVHYTHTTPRRGSDFWPGEYQKAYVHARKTYEDVLDGIRTGRMFVVAGDLVSELDVVASAPGGSATLGQTLRASAREVVEVSIRFRSPASANPRGDRPRVNRVDLIVGDVLGRVSDPAADRNETTTVLARFDASHWRQDGDVYTIETTLPPVMGATYPRVRGTNTNELEPQPDPAGEDPWTDLWFYSNPIFVEVK